MHDHYLCKQSLFRWRSSLRLSLNDIMSSIDMSAEFSWKKKLWFDIGKAEVENTLRSCRSNCILPFFKSCVREGFQTEILEVLDQGVYCFHTALKFPYYSRLRALLYTPLASNLWDRMQGCCSNTLLECFIHIHFLYTKRQVRQFDSKSLLFQIWPTFNDNLGGAMPWNTNHSWGPGFTVLIYHTMHLNH